MGKHRQIHLVQDSLGFIDSSLSLVKGQRNPGGLRSAVYRMWIVGFGAELRAHAPRVLVQSPTRNDRIDIHPVHFASQTVTGCGIVSRPLRQEDDHDGRSRIFFDGKVGHAGLSGHEARRRPEIADFGRINGVERESLHTRGDDFHRHWILMLGRGDNHEPFADVST